ncbi:unnamed protein product [Mytilus edulis]|uniref:Uncharacterized protein n=1 Tax=Mytilus edulis TaxID=6550 RepID=A0A8S3RMT3_MYTED|nr:unnamed protein product [Mytilus edulis]
MYKSVVCYSVKLEKILEKWNFPGCQDTYFGRFKPDLGRDTILLTAQLHKKTFQQIQAAVIEGKTYQPQIEENVSVRDIEKIPTKYSLEGIDNYVVFDLETTGHYQKFQEGHLYKIKRFGLRLSPCFKPLYNYSCKSLAEVQSAYWNQTPVTIHPVVVYFRGQSKLEHKSIAIISDELSHSTSTVCTFLDSLIPVLKEICPNVKCVYYWTDSPSSQYRNKTIFDLIANHSSVYGIQARWNYFEAGHGKGPCDGLGGTIKRMADEAVKRGAVVIQDPIFYSNVEEVNRSQTSEEGRPLHIGPLIKRPSLQILHPRFPTIDNIHQVLISEIL